MIAILLAFAGRHWQPIAIGAAVLAVFLAWQWDRAAQFNAGYEAAQSENRQADFEQAKERMQTDEAVEQMSDSDLCLLMGGVMQPDGTCL